MEAIIEEMRAAGLTAKFTSRTKGGEYHAPCPFCRRATGNGGEDRLCIWPADGRAWCRQCKRSVTLVALLAEILGIPAAQAHARLPLHTGQTAAHREVVEDRAKWRAKAGEVIAMGVRHLEAEVCVAQMDYLRARGLRPETIARARLGSNPQDRFYLGGDFGLAQEAHPDTGKPRKVCVPAGILIPYFDADGACAKLQSRCEDDKYGRYRVLPGSEPASLVLLPEGPVRVVVGLESALDALLCHQEVPKDYAFVALGSTAYQPDAVADALFRGAPRLLIATDSDEAGAVAQRRLIARYPGSSRLIVPPECGKDIGEAFVRGLDIREWCALGIELAEEQQRTGTTARKPAPRVTLKRASAPPPAKPTPPTATASGGLVDVHAPGVSLDMPFVVVRSVKQAKSAVKVLRTAKVVAIDIETAPLPEHAGEADAALDPWRSRPRLLQALGDGEVQLFDLDSVPLEELAPLFAGPWVAHNAVFELKHLLQAGLSPRTPYCTMLMGNAIYNEHFSLAELCAAQLSIQLDKTEQTSDWDRAELTPSQLQYAARDVVAVSLLHLRLKKEVESRDRSGICQLMHESQRAVAVLELNGLGFDAQAHGKLLRVWTRQRKSALAALTALLPPERNPNSPQQMAETFEALATSTQLKSWPRTKSGQLSTKADDLAAFMEIPTVAAYLEYVKWNGLLKNFGLKLVEQANPVTQRLHPHFLIAGANTGRMSASGPNVQGLPRDAEFRALFVPQPGHALVRADYNQMQLRIAAILSGDPRLLAAYEQGLDVHRITAARVLGKKPEDVTNEERNLAKAIGFGILFGMGPERLRCYAASDYGVVISLSEARRIRDRFFDNYPEVQRWQRAQVAEAERTGCSVTPMGRVRNFTREEKDNFHTAALNTPVQGAEGEVMLAALALLPKALDPYDALLVNCVHDELLVECPQENVETVATVVRDCMEQGMLRVFPNATLTNLVEVGQGPSWGAAK